MGVMSNIASSPSLRRWYGSGSKTQLSFTRTQKAGLGKGSVAVRLLGFDMLAKEIGLLIAAEGKKSILKEVRAATKEACREVILPQAQDLVPEDTGFLRNELKVKAGSRSRVRAGYTVGFRDPLFQGETHYGGFHEFGYDTRGGGHVEADSFLRRPLWTNEDRIRALVRSRLASHIRKQGVGKRAGRALKGALGRNG